MQMHQHASTLTKANHNGVAISGFPWVACANPVAHEVGVIADAIGHVVVLSRWRCGGPDARLLREPGLRHEANSIDVLRDVLWLLKVASTWLKQASM